MSDRIEITEGKISAPDESGAPSTTERRWSKIIYWVLIVFGNMLIAYWGIKNIARESEYLLGVPWNWGIVSIIFQILYTIASIKIIGVDEQAAVIFLGRPLFGIMSGPFYAPMGPCWPLRETRLTIEEEIPAEPEKVWHGDEEKEPMPEKKVPPIRITYKEDPESKDPLCKRITSEPSFAVRYRIINIVSFVTVIGSREQAKRQMEDTITAAASAELAKRTVANVLESWTDINKRLKNAVDILVGSWGINVESCRLKQLGLSPNLNSALSKMAQASANRVAIVEEAKGNQEKVILLAKAEETRLSLEGQGRGKAIQKELFSRAKGLEEQARRLGRSKLGPIVIAADATQRAIAESKSAIILGNNGGDIFKSLISVAELTKRKEA